MEKRTPQKYILQRLSGVYTMNKLLQMSLTFADGAEVSCTYRAGFDTAFDFTLAIRDAQMQMENLQVAYADEIVRREKRSKD